MTQNNSTQALKNISRPKRDYRVAFPVIDMERGRDIFSHKISQREEGFYYARRAQPVVEEMLGYVKNFQGAIGGVATASGMSAVDLVIHTFMAKASYSDSAISGSNQSSNQPILIYGTGVYYEIDVLLQKRSHQFNFDCKKVETYEASHLRRELEKLDDPRRIRIVWIETPENPYLGVSNIRKIKDVLRSFTPDALLVVDNSALPCFQRSLVSGADIEVMSLTKYLGQGNLMGGVVLTQNFELEEQLRDELSLSGAVLGARDSHQVIRRLSTICSRMSQHCHSANQLALLLTNHPAIEMVYYPTLRGSCLGSNDDDTIQNQMQGMGGGIVSFKLKGGYEAGDRLMQLVLEQGRKMNDISSLCITPTFGMPSTHIEHYTSFIRNRGEIQREQTSEGLIVPGFCRLAVGLAPIEKIWNDLAQVLEQLRSLKSKALI